jgi:hypothetical protein
MIWYAIVLIVTLLVMLSAAGYALTRNYLKEYTYPINYKKAQQINSGKRQDAKRHK